MSRAVVSLLLAATACTSGTPVPPAVPVSYRVIASGRNNAPCVAGPEFRVALDDASWIDLYDMQTTCLDTGQVTLPRIAFPDEIAIGAWWGIEPCPGRDVETRAVELRGAELVVIAGSLTPESVQGCSGSVGLETLLAVPVGRDELAGVRFVIDGRTVGTVALG